MLHSTGLLSSLRAGAELLGPEMEKTGEEDDSSLQVEAPHYFLLLTGRRQSWLRGARSAKNPENMQRT